MIHSFLTWVFFWGIALGLPNYLFKKRGLTFYERPWLHTLFFILLSLALCIVYITQFVPYFADLTQSHVFIIFGFFIFWILVPRLYKNDYYSKTERRGYQTTKFFEILFQDICFLGGLLTLGISPTAFGIMFFVVHLPALFLLPKNFALLPISASLFGGIIFAHLQSEGVIGFLVALFIHLTFWATLQYILQRGTFGIAPLKR